MLKKLNKFSLPEIEEKVLAFWEQQAIFQKSLDKNKRGKTFVFYEGPPTANGKPGIHHLLARSFKDLIPRYKTMQGFNVPRRAGWDAHGLPVEIAVEKELGLKNKNEIEKYGIAKFNRRAKELVWDCKGEWEKFTKRMGYWIDMRDPYISYQSSYMESLWWIFGQINKKGYLKKLQRTVPWCPRCQTSLSSHELGQPDVYQNVSDPSLFVKLRLKKPFSAKAPQAKSTEISEFLLIWTTTPWTLPGNLAVAVDPKLTYKKFKASKTETGLVEYIYSYNEPPAREGYELEEVEELKGGNLVGREYEALYDIASKRLNALKGQKIYQVYAGDFISTEEGTGLVHIAPSFGEDDYKLMAINDGLPVTITDDAKMVDGFPGGGLYIKEADKEIVIDLDKRGLLYQFSKVMHEYPHCWRCKEPLVYVVRRSWFIEMSKLRKQLINGNKKINWQPEYIKEGRFGKWLEEIKDWSISRNRYWGTPLPIWEAKESGETVVVGSLEELNKRAPTKNTIYLQRHTEARANIERVMASGPETSEETTSKLTEKGLKQAGKTAKKYKREKIDLIFASPYHRTKTTAEIIAKELGLEVKIDKRLGEINAGVFSWKSVADYREFFKDPLNRFTKTPENGENLSQLRARAMDFYKELQEKYADKRIIVVAHGDVLWMLEGAMRGLSNQGLIDCKYRPNHTSWEKVFSTNLPFNEVGELDLHRPYIDEIQIKTPKGKIATRIKDVADAWFDSGAMPYASQHFPFRQGGRPNFRKIDFPADYISEAIDQTRGWFYTLHAIAVLLAKPQAYKNVVSLGLVHDKNGKKMSKSQGNIVEPWEMMDKYGADAVRWYFYTLNDPGEPKNFNEDDLAKTVRKVILIIYNSFAFWQTYGNEVATPEIKNQPKSILDQWILAELNALIESSTQKLNEYKIGEVGREIESFIDSLSRWYIRRSRSRFQRAAKNEEASEDWKEASLVLQYSLLTLGKLVAPFMPFFADALYQSLGGREQSVHLDSWPKVQGEFSNPELVSDMSLIRDIAAKALALRAENQLKVRQPLQSLTIKSVALKEKEALLEILKDEVNVKDIIFNSKLQSEEGLELDTKITPELKEEGIVRELARSIQGLRQSADYKMADKITLYIYGSEIVTNIARVHQAELRGWVNAKNIEFKRSEKFDAEQLSKINNQEIWIAVKKL